MRNIAFVGAGAASIVMFDYFRHDAEVRIVAIVDRNPDAPGMRRARELGIPTSDRLEAVICRRDVDIVLEITGNAGVRARINELLRPDQEMLSAGGAKIMSEVLTRVTESHTHDIAERLGALVEQMNFAIGAVDSASNDIEHVLREIRILALNGNVEAARAGQAGAAFGVVVGRMNDLVTQVQHAVESIGGFSKDGHAVLDAMRETRGQLMQTTTTADA